MSIYKHVMNSFSKKTFETLQLKYLFGFPTNVCKRFISIRLFSNLEKTCNVNSWKPWKVAFYGSDEISEVTLKALNENRLSSFPKRIIEELHVVCVESSCPVRKYAMSNNLTIFTWPYSIPCDVYDIGVVVSFGHMIPSESIKACKLGMINAHPSLLPRWRGAAPLFYAILCGDTESGVTITEVSPNKFDVGKILLQETVRIPEGYTSKQLAKDLSELAAVMVLKTLKNLPEYLELSFPQPKNGITLARKINPLKCNINWEEETMSVIERKLRAFEGYFNVFTFWKNMKVVILKCLDLKEVESANISSLITLPVAPGYCYFHKRRKVLFVKCKDGWCGVTSLKIPKTGEVSSLSFYNGFISKANPKECYFTTFKNKESK